MATVHDQVKEMNAQRIRAVEAGREILERAISEKRAATAEELASYKRTEDEVNRLEQTRDALLSSDAAREEVQAVNEELRRVATPSEREQMNKSDKQLADDIRSMFRPPARAGDSLQSSLRQIDALDLDLSVPAAYFKAKRMGMPFSELRVVATDDASSGGSLTVPSLVANTIYAYMTQSVSVRRLARIITTAGGGPMSFPRVATHSIGTQIATQSTAVSGTDPVLGSMILNSYDFGELCAVSADMLEDSGVDVIGFVGEQIGRALGQVTGTKYVTGSGSSTPTGVVTAAPVGAGGTVATGGTTIFPTGPVDPFIDLQYSIADGYRQNGAAFLVNQLTAAQLRKARDGAGGTIGQYLWQPSPTVGMIPGDPDRFLGEPILSDPNVASIASNAKIAVYGDWSAFYVRDVGTLRLERSNDLYFNLNQVAFRGILRTDSNLIDTKALNILKMSVA